MGDLDASDDEDTVLLENPAYENFMRKSLKVHCISHCLKTLERSPMQGSLDCHAHRGRKPGFTDECLSLSASPRGRGCGGRGAGGGGAPRSAEVGLLEHKALQAFFVSVGYGRYLEHCIAACDRNL